MFTYRREKVNLAPLLENLTLSLIAVAVAVAVAFNLYALVRR
jgi:hypothetical protein